ncbi:hypothetical protein CYMTET_10568 [Cymbomonas tetramitiformis]|uniref:Uncharacterized protein n=1 Tax=Cymbomonas tetramitiformis TaxID=36881 RepID=A0AAE0GP53_9CHLO|nr:hypothetical protein CYMTET_10568 [Cymbomonas tetramitiformis]
MKETLQKLERLHPAGTGRGREVGEDRRRELQGQALELDERMFADVMRHLPQALGPGSSQWRWEHLWAIHISGGRDALLEMCNHLVAGRAQRRQHAKSFRARFCGRRRDDEHDGLRAVQVGVAVKGGADLCVHTVQAAFDQHPEWVYGKADAKNAFNAVHREAMFEAVERDFPEL